MVAVLILGNLRLVEQQLQDRTALGLVHALDGDRELGVHEQHLAARDRMSAHHGVHGRWIPVLELAQPRAAFGIVVEQLSEGFEIVNRLEARHELLHVIA